MSLLNGELRAHGVNLEGLCRRVLDDALNSSGAYLVAHEYEDALSYLVAVAWVLSERYDAAKGNNSFTTYCYRLCRRRVSDWYRQRWADARYHVPPEWVNIDEATLDEVAAPWEWQSADPFEGIDVQALTPESRRVLEQFARPIVEQGATQERLADQYGISRREVSKMMWALRREIEGLNRE